MQDAKVVYQVKVTLREARPPIWRRLQVRSDVTLLRLHEILQVAMGWTNSHLHQFIVRGRYYGSPDPEFLEKRENEKKVRLSEVLQKPKERMVYEYDFGDGWTHDVVLESVMPVQRGAKYPFVVGGKRACPPEDCGGVHGYADLLGAIRDPAHPGHEEMLEWVNGPFDPEEFDLREKNRAFHGGSYLPRPHG